MQEKSTKDTFAQSKTNLYTNIYSKIASESNYTCEPFDNGNTPLLKCPSQDKPKKQRTDYKGTPICKGSKHHISFQDQIAPTQQLVTYINIQSYKDDCDINSDIDFSNSNNSSNIKSVSSLSNNNTNMIVHGNKYFINYKNCCCSVV